MSRFVCMNPVLPVKVFADQYTIKTGACSYHKSPNTKAWEYLTFIDTDIDKKLLCSTVLLSNVTHVLTHQPELFSENFIVMDNVNGFDHIVIPKDVQHFFSSVQKKILNCDATAVWNDLVTFASSQKAILVSVFSSWNNFIDGISGLIAASPKVFIMKRKIK